MGHQQAGRAEDEDFVDHCEVVAGGDGVSEGELGDGLLSEAGECG